MGPLQRSLGSKLVKDLDPEPFTPQFFNSLLDDSVLMMPIWPAH